MKPTAIYSAIKNKKAITLIELIITIVLISIFILPTAKLFQQAIETLNYCNNSAMANNLLRMEMSVINNLAYSDPTLSDGYNNTETDYQGYGFILRRQVSIVADTTNAIKMVLVSVLRPAGNEVIVQAATYVGQNIVFGPASGGGVPSSGGQADYLTVSGGSISGSNLQNITLANTDTSAITITGLIVTFTGQKGIKFQSVIMDSAVRWDGNSASPITVDFTDDGKNDFTLAASTTYSNTATFSFSKNLSTISVIFIMSDGTETTAYNW